MEQTVDVIIVGAGPSGIGVSALLSQMNCHSYLILEQKGIGGSFHRWPKEMRFITPSFPAQGYGQTDLNAIVPKTSPAFTLDMEHPTGEAYTQYLELIVDHFDIPIKTGVYVNKIEKHDNQFEVITNKGFYKSKYVIWAAGEYCYPNLNPFPGAQHARHNSHVNSWSDLKGDNYIIIGGFESGMDAAYQLARLGKCSKVLAKSKTWETGNSDPSIALSTYTYNRVRSYINSGHIEIIEEAGVSHLKADQNGYHVYTNNGSSLLTKERPILATGFIGGTSIISNLIKYGEHGKALVNEKDESVVTKGLYIVGPELRHSSHIFCYIYKFRQRFAVVAHAIGKQLGLDLTAIEAYRQENFVLNDLSMCGELCQC
ncbi:Pyridine nucleotide-disulphide oxidoreductase [Amphibacillus marinus]|uniref:Pyridine nucleotide-disulphide oxidoreductase n=1 Tax=Amphibacillus marinus TaxID=872970 RepID=A0A1H8M7T5_9BACI|nr:NAD(P)/FAD-dependent oxidoreductase [Amphibacillus marinus]SEO13278.1 Pyridine nucleotide-disulphide oxidoreductase [Amphibacillus marinus]